MNEPTATERGNLEEESGKRIITETYKSNNKEIIEKEAELTDKTLNNDSKVEDEEESYYSYYEEDDQKVAEEGKQQDVKDEEPSLSTQQPSDAKQEQEIVNEEGAEIKEDFEAVEEKEEQQGKEVAETNLDAVNPLEGNGKEVEELNAEDVKIANPQTADKIAEDMRSNENMDDPEIKSQVLEGKGDDVASSEQQQEDESNEEAVDDVGKPGGKEEEYKLNYDEIEDKAFTPPSPFSGKAFFDGLVSDVAEAIIIDVRGRPINKLSNKDSPIYKNYIKSMSERPSTSMIQTPRTFRSMLLSGDTTQRQQRSSRAKSVRTTRVKESLLSMEEIHSLAVGIIDGKKKYPSDPGTIADVIEEMSNIQIEALQKSEYMRAKKIVEHINAMRTQYRTIDRNNYHRECIEDIEKRLGEAKYSFKQAQENWKKISNEMKDQRKRELKDLEEKHKEQYRQLEDKWKSPQKTRKFNKKSSYLLQRITIEKNLVLTGQFETAEQFKKQNRVVEAQEIQGSYNQMESSFELARENLFREQERELESLRQSQIVRARLFQEQQAEEFRKKIARIENLSKDLADMKDYDRFIAKKFKKSSNHVLPMTVTLGGGADLPTSGRTRASGRDTQVMKLRETVPITPLQLPKLKIKKVKRPTTKKKSSEF